MNVCLFTENHYKGGLDTFLINLVNAWPDVQDSLTLMCNASHPGLATIEAKTRRPLCIRRYRYLFAGRIAMGRSRDPFTRSLPARAVFALGFRLLEFPVLLSWYVVTLALMFRRSDYTRLIVVNGGYPASLLCRSASIAWRLGGKGGLAIHNFHNFSDREPWHRRAVENLIDRWVVKSASHFVSVSAACLESVRCRDAFRSLGKLVCIPNGIDDPGEFPHEEADGFPDGAPYLLMLATYEPRKGHRFLLDAFAVISKECPDVVLRMYGHGTPRQTAAIRNKIESLGLGARASLGDFVQDTDMLIRRARVLVIPSQEFESFGLGIIESMARRTPVVATTVGGMPEVIDQGTNGLLADPGDPAAFAAAVVTILRSPSLAARLADEGRKKFVQFYQASSMAAAYHRLLSAR